MAKKVLLRLLVILVGLSWILYAVAVPATRSSMMGQMDPSVQDQLVKEDLAMELLRNSKEIFDMEEGDVEGRMVLEITDYPPTRSNPIHDRSPGHP